MKGPFAITRVLLFVALGGLIALSFLAIRVLERDVQAYRESNQEAIHWSSAQVEVELNRFILELSRFVHGQEGATVATVNDRFDILWSRTGLFRSGEIGRRLREYDEGLSTIPLVLARLDQHEQSIVNLQAGMTDVNKAVLSDFLALRDPLRRLSVKVLSGEQQRYANVRKNLLSSSRMTFWVWVATLVLTAVLIGIMLTESRRYVRLIRQSAKLAEEAQAATRAKSRFLTMMSHEIRTPMNGVMGLMALAKQTGLNERQARLIEQAERSGEKMVQLVTDILDFSDLQTERAQMSETAFAPYDLGQEVVAELRDLVARNGLELEVDIDPENPNWVRGDFQRLRQVIVHFATYFVETIGSRDMQLRIRHDSGCLECTLDIDAQDVDRPGWQPEAIFGHDGSGYSDFASDAVGPMIARGLVDLMDGQVRMTRSISGRASLVMLIPADEMDPVRDSVRIETQSDTTALLLRAALREASIRVWEPAMTAPRVFACMVETGGDDEAERVAQLRSAHPGAQIVSVGETSDARLYDAGCSLPVDAKLLAQILNMPEEMREIA